MWLTLFLIFTGIGLLRFGNVYLDDLTRHVAGTLGRRLLEESTGIYTALPLMIILVAIAARFPWRRGGYARAVAAAIVGWAFVSVAHTSLNALARHVLSPLFGLGAYDYGDMRVRYYMEAAGDAVFYLMGITAIYALAHRASMRTLELRAAELQTQLAEATLENLRLQLHPHFLFNTLNAISSVMYEDVTRADRMLAQLSDFLRRVLAFSGTSSIRLDEELDVEAMYVSIMSTRLERALVVQVALDESSRGVRVPPLLLQPLLENAIRHGAPEDARPLHIAVSASVANGTARIVVRDDGRGLRATPAFGIGLSNVTSRLTATFGSAARFALQALPGGGTEAAIEIPSSGVA